MYKFKYNYLQTHNVGQIICAGRGGDQEDSDDTEKG